MKIISVVGARPEFIQAAPIRRALEARGHKDLWVHTGQHYDYQMSQTFFDDLGIPEPDFNLEVGSASHGRQTADMLSRIEPVLLDVRPDLVIIRGDTNSTLAAGLAAAKLHIPTAHVEAGERSYDRRMPEEINRLVADCVSDIHFCASRAAVTRLAAEGISSSVHYVGDVMYDASLTNRAIAGQKSTILSRMDLQPQEYSLVTVHRAANTDDPARLGALVEAFNRVAEPLIFPVHPRTKTALAQIEASFADHVRLIEPVGYFDMLILEQNARLIATDSGGVQREAYFLGVPCLTLRDETEWTETVAAGWNRLTGANTEEIVRSWFGFAPTVEQPPIFGDGRAAEKIVAILEKTPLAFGHPASSSAEIKIQNRSSQEETA